MDDLQRSITLIVAIVGGIILPILSFLWKVATEWEKVPTGLKEKLTKSGEKIPSKPKTFFILIFGTGFAWFLVLLFSTITIYLLIKPRSATSEVPKNPFITIYDFEEINEGWDRTVPVEVEYASDGTITNKRPSSDFPGSIRSVVTEHQALTGKGSLEAMISVNRGGTFQGYILRSGSFTANGANLYILQPVNFSDLQVDYLWAQLCIPDNPEWICSKGAYLVDKEWTALTIDLVSQIDKYGNSLAKQRVTGIAVLWEFRAKSKTSFSLHFDSGQIFRTGL